jgi:hypothetical protein
LSLSCQKEQAPAQDPLDYLRVGVDPTEEANAIMEDLRRNGFEVVRRIHEASYVAFDAVSGGESTVRVVSSRGVVLSLQAPDVRWPERLSVELSDGERPDFDRDGQRDVIVLMRERDRSCLAWAQVDARGFATEVFRPRVDWGEAPCVLEIDPNRPQLRLEVSVPDVPRARVSVPVRSVAEGWRIDDSASARAELDAEAERRMQELEARELQGDALGAGRLRAELAWLEHLRNAEEPVLEPANDGEEAR